MQTVLSGAAPVNPIRVNPPPEALRRFPQWCVWRLENVPSRAKPAKVPYDPRSGARASTVDPETWCSYTEAAAAVEAGGWNGLGFVFSPDDPFGFLDLDDCSDGSGGWQPWALAWLNGLPGSAVEVSQSGRGLHIVMLVGDKAALAGKARRFGDAEGNALEFYTVGRFVALSGREWTGEPTVDHTATLAACIPDRAGPADEAERDLTAAPVPEWRGPADDEELLRRARGARAAGARMLAGKLTFAQLFDADAAALAQHFPPQNSADPFDRSAADQALLNHLAFWTGKHESRMERLFGMSLLSQREKWRKRAYYRERTIKSATKSCNQVYVDKQPATFGEMLANFVFVLHGGSGGLVVDRRDMSVLPINTARNRYKPLTFTFETGETDNTGVPKTKTVPMLDYWLSHGARAEAAHITWLPEGGAFCPAPGKHGTAVNTWRGFDPIQPPADWQALAAVWDAHIAYLVPIEADRRRFAQWLAHIVQRPGELPHGCYLMVATQTGIGRNWIAEVLARALHPYAAAAVDIDDMLGGGFNGKLGGKLLAIADEVRVSKDRYTRAERLKQTVTESTRSINEKYGAKYDEYNACRWLMFSNHFDALPFDNNDRRIWVIENPTTRADASYYRYIYGMLANPDFIASVFHSLRTTSLEGFNPGEPAPMSAAKAKSLEAQASEADQLAADFAATWPEPIAAASMLRRFITDAAGEGALPNTGAAFKHVMQRAGIIPAKRKVKINGRGETIIIVRDLSPVDLENTSPEILARIITGAAAKFWL